MKNGFQLNNRVKELRGRLSLRQSDLAREVDVTRQTILAIEKGRLNPSIVVSLKIARVLREPVGYIFYLEREEGLEAVELLQPRAEMPGEVPVPHAICDLG